MGAFGEIPFLVGYNCREWLRKERDVKVLQESNQSIKSLIS